MNNYLCGLVAARDTSESVSTIVGRMARAATKETSPHLEIESFDSGGVAVAGNTDTQGVSVDGGLLAAYTGAPWWSDSRLARACSDSGFTDSLIAAYRRHGDALLDHLHGSFSIAIVDTTCDFALLAIDRMGICQLYLAETRNGGLIFGSKASCIQAHGGIPVEFRHQAIFDYLYFHMVPSPGSLFRLQRKLQPGECVVSRNGSLDWRSYWSPSFDETGKADRRDLESELQHLMRQAVKRCVSSDATGCFLSGGIDSSTVAGILSEMRNPVSTFTIGFQEKGYDETSFARISAEHFHTRQFEYFVSPADVVDMLPRIAAHYDEPFGNSSVVPTYYCAKLARETGIRTLLAGDGGDELFGGNVRYVTQQIFGLYDRIPNPIKSAMIEPLAFGTPGAGRFYPTRKLQSYIRQANIPMPERLESYNYFNRTPVDAILHPDFLNVIDPEAPAKMLRDTYFATNATSTLNRMLALDWKYTLADNDLRKVVSMCELAGVDVRFPFLDDDLVQFSSRVHPGIKIKRWQLRYFFKRSMRDFLPERVLSKSKHGFGLPFGIWMNSYSPLKELAYDCLTDFGKRRIVRPTYIDELIGAHRSAHAHYYGEFIWVLMMLELWLKAHKN